MVIYLETCGHVPGNLSPHTWKPGSGWCGAKKRGACAAQKVESNHCASRRLQVWSLQPGPPSVIWTIDSQFLPILNFWQISTCHQPVEEGEVMVYTENWKLNRPIRDVWKSSCGHVGCSRPNSCISEAKRTASACPEKGRKCNDGMEEEEDSRPPEALGSSKSIQLEECDRGRWSLLVCRSRINFTMVLLLMTLFDCFGFLQWWEYNGGDAQAACNKCQHITWTY